MHNRMRVAWSGVLAVLMGSAVLVPPAAALDEVDTKPLRDALTVNGIMRHERALQFIANASGGTRVAGTPGYDASADYVKRQLEQAGYAVSEQSFDFPFFQETAPAAFERVSPSPRTYTADEFETMAYAGSGDVTAAVQAVDVVVPIAGPPNTSTSGCETADFAGFTAGNIALLQRGTCPFRQKADNAAAAGASAVIVFNEGQVQSPTQPEDRTVVVLGSLGTPGVTIPVVGTSYAIGEELVNQTRAGAVAVHLSTTTISETRTTRNVIADYETGGGDRSQTIVIGSHLDSVPAGPGINDNGSGSATNLETALQIAGLGLKPRRALRFAFWGAEEEGLLGSEHYVESLGGAVADIYANLNFDMLGSPNFVRFVYDGDNSAFPAGGNVASGPPGSAQIERLFATYFAGQGLATDPTPFNGRSDYGPFIAVGIPAGGLFSGAEGLKTAEQAATYGGVAGQPYDACYHQACDTVTNLDTAVLGELGDGVAHATWTLAKSTSGLFGDESLRARGIGASRDQTFAGPLAIR